MTYCVYWISLLLLSTYFCIKQNKADRYIAAFIYLLSVFECIIGIGQLFGAAWFRSPHFNLTGTFYNPGPYGCFIAVAMALAIADIANNSSDSLSIAALLSGAFILPATQSRTGWFSLGVSFVTLLYVTPQLRRSLSGHKYGILLISVGALLVTSSFFLTKRDSALGRLHIWNIESRVILKNPVSGVGFPYVMGAFGNEQAEYFKDRERKNEIIRVAGCPQHPYNEYLRFGMAYGIGGVLMAIAIMFFVIFVLLKNNSILGYGAITWAIVAFSSYPIEVWQLLLVLTLITAYAFSRSLPRKGEISLLIVCLVTISLFGCALKIPKVTERHNSEKAWKQIRGFISADGEAVLSEYERFYPVLSDNAFFLFDYGQVLQYLKQFENSTAILRQGARISSDSMFHILMAKNCMQLGNVDEAEKELIQAHWMTPFRLYPYYLLMELYQSEGRINEAINVGEEAMQRPVNFKNKNMKLLHNQISNKLHTLKSIEQ